MIEVCDKAGNYERWRFLNKKLAQVEDKLRQEKADILLYESMMNTDLTETVKDCKIYSIDDYEEEGE